MNVDFFLKFAKFKLGSLTSAEDYADKFHYQITSAIMIVLIALIGIRQYLFTPIQCWIPHEWSRSWEEYAENFCWVQNTYFSDTKEGPPKSLDARERLKLNYYQWVPFVLALQTLLFYLPHYIWKWCSAKTGTNINHLVRFACEAATFDQDKREKLLKYISKEVIRIMESKRDDYHRRSKWVQIRNRINQVLPVYILGKRSGVLLVVIYIMIKVLYIIGDIVQIILMQKFIGHESVLFGWTMLIDISGNRTWETTGTFPRVTWCDLDRKVIANSQLNSFMCVLPVNMLNEKIYIFLWFWIILGMFLSFVSLVTWIIRMAVTQSRRSFVKKYLRILEIIKDDEIEECKIFVNQFLRHDGVFILTMISQNAGEIVASETIAGVWKLWIERRNKLRNELTQPSAPPMYDKEMSEENIPMKRRPSKKQNNNDHMWV